MSLWLIAIFLPIAFPPIVRDEIIEVNNKDRIKKFIFSAVLNLVDMAIQQAPDITPQISPITSLQKLDTLSVFCLNFTASFAPLTFLAAIELKTLMLEAVTATPIISNIIPMITKNSTKKIPKYAFIFGNNNSDNKDIISDSVKVNIIIIIIQLVSIIFFFL